MRRKGNRWPFKNECSEWTKINNFIFLRIFVRIDEMTRPEKNRCRTANSKNEISIKLTHWPNSIISAFSSLFTFLLSSRARSLFKYVSERRTLFYSVISFAYANHTFAQTYTRIACTHWIFAADGDSCTRPKKRKRNSVCSLVAGSTRAHNTWNLILFTQLYQIYIHEKRTV